MSCENTKQVGDNEIQVIKCVVIGDEEIGKTCMLTRYTNNNYPVDYIPTVFDAFVHYFKSNDRHLCLDLWDTAGRNDYDRLRPHAYENTDVFLICFSVMKSESLRNVEHKWYPEVREQFPNAKMILVGTQIDMHLNKSSAMNMNKFIVTYREGVEMANKINALQYLECSALTRFGLAEVFEAVAKSVTIVN